MSATHTPGPWIADEDDYVSTPLGRIRIAKVYSGKGNARLIANAPEMRALLERFVIGNHVDCADGHPPDCICTTGGGCPYREAATLLADIDG